MPRKKTPRGVKKTAKKAAKKKATSAKRAPKKAPKKIVTEKKGKSQELNAFIPPRGRPSRMELVIERATRSVVECLTEIGNAIMEYNDNRFPPMSGLKLTPLPDAPKEATPEESPAAAVEAPKNGAHELEPVV